MATLTLNPMQTERQRLGARRRAIAALGPAVRTVLTEAAEARWPDGRWELSLTVYDAMIDGHEPADGHWTLTRFAAADERVAESYTITLCFDREGAPVAFAVAGQRRIFTAGARPALLAPLLAEMPPRRRCLGPALRTVDWFGGR